MFAATHDSCPSTTRHTFAASILLAVLGCADREAPSPIAEIDSQPPNQTTNERIVSLTQIPGADVDRFHAFLAPVFERQDPQRDGWDSEFLADEITQRLKLLGKKLATPSRLRNSDLADWSVANFAARQPPQDLQPIVDDPSLHVRRAPPLGGTSESIPLADVLQNLLKPLATATNIRVKFKLFRIHPSEQQNGQVTTSAYYQASGELPAGLAQQNATWHCVWDASTRPLRFVQLSIDDYEEVLPKTSGRLTFTDVTQSALGNTDSFRQQLTRGVDYWRGRLEANYGVDPNGNQGLTVGDVNGDGLDDVFVCQQGGLPNRLYVQNVEGTLRDVSAAAGVDWMEVCRSALLVDLDNDGDQDLVMAQGWYAMIMTNDGTGKFTVLKEVRSSANLYSTAAADYDNDGDLDLFFCGRNPGRERNQFEGILGTPIPYHDANNGGPNLFWRNDGAGAFTDVTVESGLDVNNRRYSYAASWEDYDNDGDMDLYVANDFGRNNLYRNLLIENGQPRFEDVAQQLGVEDISAGMSVTWGDWNNDGLPDIYISNMFSSAGNRIAYQRQFRPDASGSLRSFQRHARGNTLFTNTGDGFRDESVDRGVTMGRWAWGSKFADFNNDSLLDIYVTNGFITTEDTGDL